VHFLQKDLILTYAFYIARMM